jgi:hypothetical protein
MTDSPPIDLPPGGDLSADRLESYHYRAIATEIPDHMDSVADDLLDVLDTIGLFGLQDAVLPTYAHWRETLAGLHATAERLRAAARATSLRPHEASDIATPDPAWDV